MRSPVRSQHRRPAISRSNELPYQAIFCRNVLIYLHESARSTALTSLHRLLADSGILFAGHAEALENMSRHFRRAGSGFAFVKRSPSERPAPARAAPAPERRKICASVTASTASASSAASAATAQRAFAAQERERPAAWLRARPGTRRHQCAVATWRLLRER